MLTLSIPHEKVIDYSLKLSIQLAASVARQKLNLPLVAGGVCLLFVIGSRRRVEVRFCVCDKISTAEVKLV